MEVNQIVGSILRYIIQNITKHFFVNQLKQIFNYMLQYVMLISFKVNPQNSTANLGTEVFFHAV